MKNEAMAAEEQMEQLGHDCSHTDTRMKGFNCVCRSRAEGRLKEGEWMSPGQIKNPIQMETVLGHSSCNPGMTQTLKEQPGMAGRGMEAPAVLGLTKG